MTDPERTVPPPGEDGEGAGDAAEAAVDRVSVTIAAPPGAVWDMVADVTRMGEWSPECYSCRWVGARREPVPGALFVGFNRRGWARWITTNQVERAEPGRAFAFRTRETRVRWGYELEPEDGGTATRLTETRDLSEARSWLIALFGPFVGGADSHADEVRAGMRQTITRLKAAAEQV